MVLTGPVPFALTWLMIQVGVRGAGPAGASVVEPFAQDLVGELVNRADPAGDGESPVAEVDVLDEPQGDDGGCAGGVHAGQHQDESGDRGLGDLDGVVHL